MRRALCRETFLGIAQSDFRLMIRDETFKRPRDKRDENVQKPGEHGKQGSHQPHWLDKQVRIFDYDCLLLIIAYLSSTSLP